MLLGKNEVIEWIGLNDTPCWQLSRSEKGEKIVVKEEPDNLTIEESQDYLGRVLDMFEKGTYYIAAWEKGTSNNARFKSGFRLGAVAGSIDTAGIGDLGDIESRVMEKLRKEMEFERLKAENEELKREIDTVSHRVSQKLEPYIPGIMEGVFGLKIQTDQAAQIAGIPPEDLEDQQERLEAAFKKWFKIEKEASPVILVEKIVELAQRDPEKYGMAKKLLIG